MQNSKITGLIVLVLIILVGVVTFRMGAQSHIEKIIPADPKTSDLLNPTVTATLNRHFIINFKPLRMQFQELQTKYTHKSYIYFAYLNNSSWSGLNERELFTAASTIKVPLAMTIYKMEEQGKIKVTDRYTLAELDLDDNFGDLYKVGADKTFSIEELIKIMLDTSDNTAMNALYRVLTLVGITDPLEDVYTSMGWDYNNFGETPVYVDINLKTLSNMFLALYNAQYISVANSQKLLQYLTESPFSDQLAHGVGRDVRVAHKIGVAADKKTYSDCGIVYAPNRPYLLCVASEGADKKDASDFIAEISRLAYQYVINN